MAEEAAKGDDRDGGGDIITVDTFDNFDLQFEWKVIEGANSGVKYLVTEIGRSRSGTSIRSSTTPGILTP